MEPVATPPPVRRGRPRRRIATRWLVLGACAVVVAVVWAAGGFRGGSEISHEQVGRSFDIGPATITVRSATATKSWSGGWSVTVEATCQVSAQQPPTLLGDEVVMASTTRPVLTTEDVFTQYGPRRGYATRRSYLPPDLSPMQCSFKGDLPASYRPDTGVKIAFNDLAFGDDSVMGNQDPHWYPANGVHLLTLPVSVVAN